jgi:fructosamine-3-kinase
VPRPEDASTPRFRSTPEGLFRAEVDGLRLLKEAGTLAVPEVVAFDEGTESSPAFLLLHHFGNARRRADFFETLGRGLAALHRNSGQAYGHGSDNFIGTLDQRNTWAASWPEFFAERRLLAQARLGEQSDAVGSERIGSECIRAVERLCAKLGGILPSAPETSLLHGDLWSGNVAADSTGSPVIYDPAVYFGHREVELAFTELFGGFSDRFYAAYNASWPLEPGYAERRDVYNLYPILVHANLFGGSYEGQALSILRRFV